MVRDSWIVVESNDDGGKYTAPGSAGVITVTATSVADITKSASRRLA